MTASDRVRPRPTRSPNPDHDRVPASPPIGGTRTQSGGKLSDHNIVPRVRDAVTSEAELQAAVLDFAATFGWRVAHFRAARTARGWRTPVAAAGGGWPDLVLVHVDTRRLIVRELKAERGRLTDEQVRWLDDLRTVGVDAGVWRPADWGDIVSTLSNGRATT